MHICAGHHGGLWLQFITHQLFIPGTFVHIPTAWQVPPPEGGLGVGLGGLGLGGLGLGGLGVGKTMPSDLIEISEHALKCSWDIGSSPRPHLPVIGSQPQLLPAVYVHWKKNNIYFKNEFNKCITKNTYL